MKKWYLIIIFFLLGFFLQPFLEKAQAQKLAAPDCSGYYGKFMAKNWPGGKVTLVCEGAGRQRGQCVGQSKTLAPGESYSFTHCNCLDKSMSCIAVTSKLPKGCKLATKFACAANRQSIKDNFTVECTKASTPGKKQPPVATDEAPIDGGLPPVATNPADVPPVASDPAAPVDGEIPPVSTDAATTYQTPPWYCLALGERVGTWVGCDKKE
jgi:hypothetical protein